MKSASVWAKRLSSLMPISTNSLSDKGRVRLLDVTISRMRFGIVAFTAITLTFIGLVTKFSESIWLMGLGIYYVAFTGFIWYQSALYHENRRKLSAPDLVARWRVRLNKFAVAHGAGMGLLVFLTTGKIPYDYSLLLHVSLAAVTLANSAYRTPGMGGFLRFFIFGWGVAVLLTYWTFPAHWQLILPLSLLYSLSIYKSSIITHRFTVEQVRLEELSQQLVEQFKSTKEEAEDALNEKNLFLATASHDLRQPVHAMSMLVEAIGIRNKDDAVAPLLIDLKSSMNSLNQMFNSLLDLSKLEAAIVPSHAVPIVLSSILKDVADMFREQATSRGLQLRLRTPRTDALVMADEVLLRQAVVNLTHNALRYTQRGGILISMRSRGPDWLIEVWDTGIGIATQDEQQVFSPYYRGELAWQVDSAGHGLGLAVVARCAKLMGARYGVSSRVGTGSRFWLSLTGSRAQLKVHPAGREIAMQVQTDPSRIRTLVGKCLVVEDDVQVISAWKAMLEGWGVEGRYATTGIEAQACLEDGFIPQAIFCDQRLRSGESGFDILQALLMRCPRASGAMVSGEYNSLELHHAESEGYWVLRKPLDLVALHAVLEKWLSN